MPRDVNPPKVSKFKDRTELIKNIYLYVPDEWKRIEYEWVCTKSAYHSVKGMMCVGVLLYLSSVYVAVSVVVVVQSLNESRLTALLSVMCVADSHIRQGPQMSSVISTITTEKLLFFVFFLVI